MNAPYGAPSSRGPLPHVEASAGTAHTNASTPQATGEPTRAQDIQVPRSPQHLSLRIDGQSAQIYNKYSADTSYIESSERGSDTSGDSQRPELQSASTAADSLISLPSSSLDDNNRSMALGDSRSLDENAQTPKADHQGSDSPEISRTSLVDGKRAIDGIDNTIYRGGDRNGPSPSRSPKRPTSRSGTGMQSTSGHKRTATGDIKPLPPGLAVPQVADTNGGTRRRSKSTGSPAHGSRIAQVMTFSSFLMFILLTRIQLSVHIRTRLSYAAAKIEKTRQSRENHSQLPLRGLDTLASLNSQSSSDTTPTLASNPTSYPQHHNKRSPTDSSPSFSAHHRSQSALPSPGKMLPIPKLAPPVDIISSNGDTRRRRPNPNLAAKSFECSPYVRHRRHHSHQEHSMARPSNGSPSVVGLGTPSIPPSRAPTSSQNGFYGSQTSSQNTLMEQDAIETLVFMSSPENSGYRSSPRSLQPAASQRSLNESIYSNHNGMYTNPSQGTQSDASHGGFVPPPKNYGLELEARAGDEIDKLLDQMESDSEDDARYAAHRHRIKGQLARGYHGQPR